MLFEKARAFIELMYQELNLDPVQKQTRINDIELDIHLTGTYTHTKEELEYGAKVAWRNSNRCIGRLYWESLIVNDLRDIVTEEDFIESIDNHIRSATNGGKILPTISIYSNDFEILNEQLIRYAGYESVGDPFSRAVTKTATDLGWKSEPGDFNILPLVYRHAGGELKFYEYDRADILEVHIEHDEFPALGDLGLKWYAVPIVSKMDLEIGGIRYHTAPFNGWYVETEIGVRNFTDHYRYDKLREIAEAFGFDTKKTSSFWRDRALIEFNYALFQSYKRAGVSIVDHYTATKLFKQFENREREAGRDVTGKWSWLAPVLSPSLAHNYHHGYNDTTLSPNFLDRGEESQCPFSV